MTTTTKQSPDTPHPDTPLGTSFLTPEMIVQNPVLAAAGSFAGDPLWREVREEIKRNRERDQQNEEQTNK